ncbi:MAG: hypothetical protein QM760_05920 [Nibricoccus sp.]
MKPLLLLLGLSLAANAALFLTRPAPAPSSFSVSTSGGSSNSRPSSAAASASSDKSAVPPGPYAPLWEKLRTGDASVVASLRAAGWPEEAIRALVEAQVNDLYRARSRALTPDYSKVEYWRQNPYSSTWTADTAKAWRDLNREKTAMLKKLLGDDYAPVPNLYAADRYPNLTPAQIETVQAIEEDYRVLRYGITGTGNDYNSILLPEDREKLAYLEKEKTADLSKVISADTQLELDLRNSNAASQLRFQLTAFDPSEEEFRKIFALQKTATDALGITYSNATAAQREALNKSQASIDAQVKEILTPERYADYTRAKDYEYRRLYQLTERLELPKDKALAAYAVKADIEKRYREIKPTPGPDGAKAAAAARSALAQEAEQLLVESLGQRGYDAYKSAGANWLTRMTPAAATR